MNHGEHGHIHNHDHNHDHHADDHAGGHAPRAERSLRLALVLTASFTVVEAVGGWWANSLALMTDAAHMLTDVGALSLSLFAVWISRRSVTPEMSYGYHRAEILGALVSGVAIWILSGGLIYQAVSRLSQPPEVRGETVTAIAVAGLFVNLFALRALHGSHEHNLSVRAAYLHVVGDLLGSIGAIAAGAAIWAADWRLADPLVTILFAAIVLYSSWRLVREAVAVLMEGAPVGVDPLRVKRDLAALVGVNEVHDLHIWSVGSRKNALSVHLIASESSAPAVLRAANEMLERTHGIVHTTIQVEDPKDVRADRCYSCQTTN